MLHAGVTLDFMSHTINRLAARKLPRLHEHNYGLLIKLIPGLDRIAGKALSAPRGETPLHLKVLETTRYTTTISLTEYIHTGCLSIAYPEVEIRLYHDARVAEVLQYRSRTGLSWLDNTRRFRDQGNMGMERLNGFLGQWLRRCLSRGHCFDSGDHRQALNQDPVSEVS
jgi:uncharacterized protein YqiB (DUF1249 family)